jgi:hypothetical protein
LTVVCVYILIAISKLLEFAVLIGKYMKKHYFSLGVSAIALSLFLATPVLEAHEHHQPGSLEDLPPAITAHAGNATSNTASSGVVTVADTIIHAEYEVVNFNNFDKQTQIF